MAALYGTTFLGRDEKTWGEEVGWIPISQPLDCSDTHTRPPVVCPTPPTPPPPDVPIHVTLASYRDALCPRTLHSLFTRAVDPGRVYVRVLEQTEPGTGLADDEPCFDMLCEVRDEWGDDFLERNT